MPGKLLNPGIEPASLASPILTGRFFTTTPLGKPDAWYLLVNTFWMNEWITNGVRKWTGKLSTYRSVSLSPPDCSLTANHVPSPSIFQTPEDSHRCNGCQVFPGGTVVKNPPAVQAKQETQVQFLVLEDPLEKEMAAFSSILAWKITWTEEPGRLQSMESQTV